MNKKIYISQRGDEMKCIAERASGKIVGEFCGEVTFVVTPVGGILLDNPHGLRGKIIDEAKTVASKMSAGVTTVYRVVNDSAFWVPHQTHKVVC